MLNRTKRTLTNFVTCTVPVVASLAVAGCAGGAADDLPKLAPVSGTVTLDGQPLADAQLVFEPANGSPSVGKTDAQGHYTLVYQEGVEGAMLGQHTVRITKYGEPGSPNDTMNQLPAAYDQGSELTATVVEGKENTFDFELKSQPEG